MGNSILIVVVILIIFILINVVNDFKILFKVKCCFGLYFLNYKMNLIL